VPVAGSAADAVAGRRTSAAKGTRRRRMDAGTQLAPETRLDIPLPTRNATSMPRPLSPEIDEALHDATLQLLAEDGFARMSVAAVAGAAGVGKPAVYRRFRNKAQLVVAAIAARVPEMHALDLGDTEAELRAVALLPEDGAAYVGLIGGLMAEHRRHPELIAAFRDTILLPRLRLVQGLVERGQERGHVRRDLAAETAVDLFAGPFLARVFAGADTGPDWRDRHFTTWWELIKV
jgi:AcrR family transcriptional regulator